MRNKSQNLKAVVPILVVGLFVSEIARGQEKLETIIDGIRASEAQLFESGPFFVIAQRVKSEVVTPSRFGGGYLNVEFLVAYKEGQYLCHKHFLSDDIGSDSEIYLPPAPTIMTSQDGIFFRWQKAGMAANVDSFERGSDMFRCIDYFRHTGLDVAKYMAGANQMDYKKIRAQSTNTDALDHPFLPACIENNKSQYVVHRTQEAVDGFPCWVVEFSGMDKIWVDPAHGFAVRRRVYNFAPGQPRKFEIWNKDLREVKTGLWLPWEQVVDKYASITAEDRKIWGQVASRMHYRVSDMSVGTVPSKLFDLQIPNGLLISDSIRRIEYSVSTNESDPFAGIMNDARDALNKGAKRRKALALGSILLLAVVALALVVRSRGGKRTTRWAAMLLSLCLFPCFPLLSRGEQAGPAIEVNPSEEFADHDFGLAERHVRRSHLALGSGPFNWVPSWRSRGDCGPCALYVMMTLKGHGASLAQVKGSVAYDPDLGCSLDSLVQAGKRLGFDVEPRFASPSQVASVPPPFVLHGMLGVGSETGHYLVVVGFDVDTEQFTVVDPVTARISTNPASSILQGYSGYLLVPRSTGLLSVVAWALACLLPLVLLSVVCRAKVHGLLVT